MHRQIFLALPPGAVGRGQKVKYHLISITKPISKIIIQNFVCVFPIKDTKHIRQDFHSVPGLCPRGWAWGCLGVKNQIMPRRLYDMLSPHKPLDEIQPNLVCELLT